MDKEALQILNMFMKAAQMAKARNTYEVQYHIKRETLLGLLKKAFPLVQNEANLLNIVDMALKG